MGANFSMMAAVVKIALQELVRHKGRSALTMLGIVIGVAAVIAMVSLGQGASQQVQQQIESMGTNMLIVSAGSQNTGGLRGGAGTSTTLTPDDAEAILRDAPAVGRGQPQRGRLGDAGVRQPELDHACRRRRHVVSRRSAIAACRAGDFFSDADVTSAARVAVIGQTVANQLFPGMDPVGQTLRVRNLPFRVVGVLEAKGQSQWGQDQDDTLLMPYTTAMKKLLSTTLHPDHLRVRGGERRDHGGRAADRRHPAVAAQPAQRAAGRLHGPQPDGRGEHGGGHHARDDACCWAASRRYRCWWAGSGS